MDTNLTTRQMTMIATNALLDRIDADGLTYCSIQIESGLSLGGTLTTTIARAHCTRIGDTSRSPAEVIVTASADSDATVARVLVIEG